MGIKIPSSRIVTREKTSGEKEIERTGRKYVIDEEELPYLEGIPRGRPNPTRKNTYKRSDKHQGRKPQNILDPIQTNLINVEHTKSDIVKGPIYTPKHIYYKERSLADRVIAHTPNGKRIFAYNNEKRPICYGRISGSNTDRCQSTSTMMNGRCVAHGGKAARGLAHHNAIHLRTSDSLPDYLQSDMKRAELDPDLLSLNFELELTDVRLKQLMKGLDLGLGKAAQKHVSITVDRLDNALTEGKSSKIIAELAEEVILAWRKGKSEELTWEKIDEQKLVRKQLVAVAQQRERDLRMLLKAEQVMTLVRSIAYAVKSCTDKFIKSIENRYNLIDKETGIPAMGLDLSLKNDFLFTTTNELRKLVSNGDRPTAHTDEMYGNGSESNALMIEDSLEGKRKQR